MALTSVSEAISVSVMVVVVVVVVAVVVVVVVSADAEAEMTGRAGPPMGGRRRKRGGRKEPDGADSR